MSGGEPPRRPRRILIDLTLKLTHAGRPTGIPRVAEEIIRRFGGTAPGGTKLGRVMFLRGRWHDVSGTPLSMLRARQTANVRAQLMREQLREAERGGDRLTALRLRIGRLWFRTVSSLLSRIVIRRPHPEVGPGDVILNLDMQSAALPAMDDASARGAAVVCVLYDCLPITHPELFPIAGLKESYREWFDWVSRQGTGLVAISATAMHEARRLRPGSPCWHGWFHLGGDLPVILAREPRPALREALSRPAFLMVGTVEARKNHAFAVEAMEKAWARGCPASLIIVGGRGWNNDALMARIAELRAAGRPLVVAHDVEDAELAAVYAGATALLAASVAEGYGLPVAEAAVRGLPVLASDIPVFREIAPEDTAFFALGDTEGLSRLIERTAAAPRRRNPGRHVLTWEESMRRLLTVIENSGRLP